MAPALSVFAFNSLQAFVLRGFGNVLGQAISSYDHSSYHTLFAKLDFFTVIVFASWALFYTPVFLLWNSFLDKRYPTVVKVPDTSAPESKEAKKEKEAATKDELQRGNVLIKTVLTESLLSTVMNGIFVAYFTYMRTGDPSYARQKVQSDLPDIQTSSMKLWPIVTYISLVYLPVERRMLVRSLVGIFWNVYLSIAAQ
ncbi:hypothetical protein BZA70DRAFT_45569 [Myxozyma melibiosi]|uniref:Integral membrane protein n=1 Tax=Myxozyma melibiosi TaxID=54550 RepID=A0ABR1FF12_9ASCO